MRSTVLYGIGIGGREIVTVAFSQLGNVGGRLYWSWYGFESRVDRRACFISWYANECDYLDTGVIPKSASCSIGIQWFRKRGLWQDRSYEPRPGNLIFFDWGDEDEGQDGAADHVGIVEKMEDEIVYAMEDNPGNACRERQCAIGYTEIYGYGTPAYWYIFLPWTDWKQLVQGIRLVPSLSRCEISSDFTVYGRQAMYRNASFSP